MSAKPFLWYIRKGEWINVNCIEKVESFADEPEEGSPGRIVIHLRNGKTEEITKGNEDDCYEAVLTVLRHCECD